MRAKAILVCAFLLISAIGAGAATYKTLHSFGGFGDGQSPYPGVIFDQAGNLYGVVAWGEESEGTIFQLTPSPGDWRLNILHQFSLQDPDGAGPIGGLARDEAGNLYGTASYGHSQDSWCGTVFELSPSGGYWMFTVLHYFTGADGCDPEATLSYSSGWLWGTTRSGGFKDRGTVFSMQTSGESFQSDSFSGKCKGNNPMSAFNLWGYGTTVRGGAKDVGNMYRLDPAKGLINKYSFTTDGKAGYAPLGDLLALYVGGVRTIFGTTQAGGEGGGGTVYRLTEIQPNSDRWRISVLHSFSSTSGSGEGWAPVAGLTADSAGNLYGTTYKGGLGCGTVFKLSPGKNNHWTHTVLHSFDDNYSEGCGPLGGVVLDKAGNLYGTTEMGGDYVWGTVYEITP